jgi:hypothetical protein
MKFTIEGEHGVIVLPKGWKVEHIKFDAAADPNFVALDPTEDPSLTPKQRLYETSHGLVSTLLALIDSYGYRGVLCTLEDIKEVYLPEQVPQDIVEANKAEALCWREIPVGNQSLFSGAFVRYFAITENHDRFYDIIVDERMVTQDLERIVEHVGSRERLVGTLKLGAEFVRYSVLAPYLQKVESK